MLCLSKFEHGSSNRIHCTSDKTARANFKRCFIPEEKCRISLCVDFSNPNKFIYNKVYNKTTTNTGCVLTLLVLIAFPLVLLLLF